MPRGKKAVKEDEPISAQEAIAEMKGHVKYLGEEAQTKAIVPYQDSSVVDVHPDVVQRKLDSIRVFQELVRKSLIDGQDYGTIPGTPKPTLLKPGAEKIIKLMNLADMITIEDKIEDWEHGFFYYRAKCELVSLISNQIVATGIGSCNSKEDRYRWRWVAENYMTAEQKARKDTVPFRVRRSYGSEFNVYRFENEEIFTQVNTLLKIAKKRALVDAALSVGRLSNLFTQDIEDMGEQATTEFFSQSPQTKREAEPKRKPGPKPKGGFDKAPEDPAKEEPEHPKPQKNGDSHPMIQLTLTNGSKINVTQFQALDYFKAIKESLSGRTGDDAMYYATLEQFGYKHSKEIPIEKISGVWDTMVSIWKMHDGKGKK